MSGELKIILLMAKIATKDQLVGMMKDMIKEYDDAPESKKDEAFKKLEMMAMILAAKSSTEEMDDKDISDRFKGDISKN